MEHESDGDTDDNWRGRYNHQRIGKATERFSNKRTSEDYSNYSITKIGLNTEESPGDLRRFTVRQTPVEDHLQMLLWKTLKLPFIRPYIPETTLTDYMCQKKRRRKRISQHWRRRWNIDTTTQRLHRRVQWRTNYSHQKRYWQHEDQGDGNNQKTKVGRKTNLWTF